MKMKAVLAFLALMVDFCRGWCVGIGQNPTFKGKPLIQQLSDLSSVRVSWEGLVDYRECADQFLVSYWIKGQAHDYQLTKYLDPSTSSVVIEDIKLNVPYVYQVIAREDKGFLGIDYNRSPNIQFTIGRSNIHRPTTKAKKEPEDDVTKTTASASSDVTVVSGNSTS